MARSLRAAEFLAVSLVILPLGARVAEACSCYENPPCSAVWRADAVFVGTVVEQLEESLSRTLSWTVHKVVVDRRLHGAPDSRITLVPGVNSEFIEASKSSEAPSSVISTCDYRFDVGRQYVIYAKKTADGRWTTSMCAGTKPIEEAAGDLEYIARIPVAAPTGRVYGSIERMLANSTDPAEQRVAPAAGVRVELTSSSTPADRDDRRRRQARRSGAAR
jgi:hypothetical protein